MVYIQCVYIIGSTKDKRDFLCIELSKEQKLFDVSVLVEKEVPPPLVPRWSQLVGTSPPASR